MREVIVGDLPSCYFSISKWNSVSGNFVFRKCFLAVHIVFQSF